MSAVLVTGGAGYIGSHAVKALRKAGHRIVIYDNLSAGHREAALRAGGGAAELVEGDIGDTARVRRRSRSTGSTRSCTSRRGCRCRTRSAIRPAYYRNNVLGALSVLDAMIATGTKHFVFSSTVRGVR